MDKESNEIIAKYIQEIGNVHDEIGTTDEEKKTLFKDSISSVKEIFMNLLKKGLETKNTIEKEILETSSTINDLKKMLRMDEEEQRREGSSENLLSRRRALAKRKEELIVLRNEREQTLSEMHKKVQRYFKQLEMNPNSKYSIDPNQFCNQDLSLKRISSYKELTEEMETEREDRLEVFRDVLSGIKELEQEMQTKQRFSPKLVSSNESIEEVDRYDLKWKEIELMKEYLKTLKQKKEKRLDKMEVVKNSIKSLLIELSQDPSNANNFFQKNQLATKSSLNALRKEEENIKKNLHTKIENLVENSFQEIQQKYELLHYTQNDRIGFPSVTECKSFEEAQKILSYLREVSENLSKEYERSKQIFELIDKRGALREKKNQLEVILADSSRLLSKKPRFNLLEEEKLRNEVSKIPEFEKSLIEKIKSWENTFSKKFIYDGLNYVEVKTFLLLYIFKENNRFFRIN